MEIKIESSEKEFQELVEKRKLEIQQAVTKKVQKYKFWYVIVELVVTIGGYGMLWYFFNWQLALGLFLIQWGNNMAQSRNIHKEPNLWKEIWKYRN